MLGGGKSVNPKNVRDEFKNYLIQLLADLKHSEFQNFDFSAAIHLFLAGEGPADAISKFKSIK
jgi:hypothetical protein